MLLESNSLNTFRHVARTYRLRIVGATATAYFTDRLQRRNGDADETVNPSQHSKMGIAAV